MRQISEKETRKALIDPALEKAGWYLKNHAQVEMLFQGLLEGAFGGEG